jgi:hypothetical protein
MFGHNPFADSPFAALPTQGGGTSITGTLAVTLDDIAVASAGAIAHNGNLAVTLDDITFAGAGVNGHTGSLAISLDDIAVAVSGIVNHNGTLALTLDDIIFAARGAGKVTGEMALALESVTFLAAGANVHAGSLAVTLEDIIFLANQEPEPSAMPTKGGYKPKKKEYQKTTQEIESAVSKAIDKVFGVKETPVLVDEKEVKVLQEPQYNFADEYYAQLQEQAKMLNLTIEQHLIDIEKDDEEALLMLL